MTPSPSQSPSAPALVLHVVPADIARGGQTYVRALRDALDGDSHRHRTLTLFGPRGTALQPDVALGVGSGKGRQLGLDPVALMRLRRGLRQLQPALVVAHGGESLKYLELARRPPFPVIYHRIGISSHKLRNPLRRAFHRALIRRVDAVVAISEDTLAELRDFLPPPSPLMVAIDNARDAAEFAPAATKEGKPRVLFLGHLVRTKRPELFVDVIDRLRGEGLDFEAVIVGDGPLRDLLEDKAVAAGVELLGRRDDVPALLRQASILVFTSVAEGEGLPGVLIEAGLSGIPSVSTDVPGARSAVLDRETGFVVGVNDEEALMTAVRRLVLDAELRTRMGREARRHCLANFSIQATAAKWNALINEVITTD